MGSAGEEMIRLTNACEEWARKRDNGSSKTWDLRIARNKAVEFSPLHKIKEHRPCDSVIWQKNQTKAPVWDVLLILKNFLHTSHFWTHLDCYCSFFEFLHISVQFTGFPCDVSLYWPDAIYLLRAFSISLQNRLANS